MESINKRIQAALPDIMRRRKFIPLKLLRHTLVDQLGVRLREDYLVANLLGVKGYWLDCEDKILWRADKL